MRPFPAPGRGDDAVTIASASGSGPQWWAGAPSAVLQSDRTFAIAYRVRHGSWRDDEVVIARSADGVRLETLAIVDKRRHGAAMIERPALIQLPNGAWRMYASLATPGSFHWWVGLLEAETLEGLADAEQRVVFPGGGDVGVKDPVVRFDGARWHAWLCHHLLDTPGAEDRMETAYATSADGITWSAPRTILRGRPGRWDARGARVTAVLPDGRAAYDGRASREENWFERTGLAQPAGDGPELVADGDTPVSTARYLDVVPLPDGGYRLFYEQVLPDETHELRTELIPAERVAGKT